VDEQKENRGRYNVLSDVIARLRMEKDLAEPELAGQKPPAGLSEQERQKWEKQADQEAYRWLVEQHKPKAPVKRNLLLAFLVGGTICAAGQVIMNYFQGAGLGAKEAAAATSLVMVFLGAFLTGLGVYDSIGKVGGAGSIVPITGFANSIVSSAMEFKREGYVYGLGARLFTVAGPVLVYGFIVSVLIGLVTFYFSSGS